jgi:RNA polymerase sigma-70 factor (ECF subfamily)
MRTTKPTAHGTRETDADRQSDHALIARIADRDQAAMKTLMKRHQLRIFRFVIRFVSNRELAEDAVRDTFLVAWRSADRFEGRSSVSTWLLAIARNRALSARQRLALATEPLSETLAAELIDPRDLPDAVIERRQSIAHVRKCLLLLPPSDGELFDLVYYHEKTLSEVALITNAPVNTVKTRMSRARQRLGAILAAQEDGLAKTAPAHHSAPGPLPDAAPAHA